MNDILLASCFVVMILQQILIRRCLKLNKDLLKSLEDWGTWSEQALDLFNQLVKERMADEQSLSPCPQSAPGDRE
jgi:flagellar biosynthesis protein FlhB